MQVDHVSKYPSLLQAFNLRYLVDFYLVLSYWGWSSSVNHSSFLPYPCSSISPKKGSSMNSLFPPLGASYVLQSLIRCSAFAHLSSPSFTVLCYRAHLHYSPRGFFTVASRWCLFHSCYFCLLTGCFPVTFHLLLISSPQGFWKILINLSYRYRTLSAP